jgi:large repetitive protein
MNTVRRHLIKGLVLATSVATIIGVANVGVAAAQARGASNLRTPALTDRPHAVGVVAHTYNVNTTTDDYLSGSAPDHTCQDETNAAKCSLRSAIEAANYDFDQDPHSWDVVNVPQGTYTLSSSVDSNPLTIDEAGDLTINGAGPTETIINGSSFDHQILNFDDEGDSLSVSGVEIEGGYSADGAGVFIGEYMAASFSDCAFVDNDASEDGGAIYVAEFSPVSITHSTFTGNWSEYEGGAIADYSESANLTLSGDTFSHNYTDYESSNNGGGAVFSGGQLNIDNSKFENDTTESYGGAIFSDDNSLITSTTFSGDNAEYDGGAVYNDLDMQLVGDTFKSDAGEYGGGLDTADQAILIGDTFTTDDASEAGADINNSGSVTVSGSTLTDGTSSADGGSIFSDDSLTLSADTITGARALGDDGDGGAIYLDDGHASLTDTDVTHSSVPNGMAYGAGIFCDECQLAVIGGSISDNTAEYGGGGVSVEEESDASIFDTTISGNKAEWGAGVLDESDSVIDISESTISNNTGTFYYGAGVSINYGAFGTITDSTLSGNTAKGSDGWGGGVAAYGSGSDYGWLYMDNDTVADNSATYGGGVYAYDSYVTMNSTTIAYNKLLSGSSADDAAGVGIDDSTVAATGSLLANNVGNQCDGPELVAISGGYNIDSDNTCGLFGAGDIVGHAVKLNPLAKNGGLTETVAPMTSSLAIGNGGSTCADVDQRGVAVPSGAKCDVGSVFVEGSTSTLSLTKTSIVKGHEQSETFKVVVTGAKGTKPTGIVDIDAGSKLLCFATLSPAGVTTARGACSLNATQLKSGTYTVTAAYLGGGAVASSVSSSKSVKVT